MYTNQYITFIDFLMTEVTWYVNTDVAMQGKPTTLYLTPLAHARINQILCILQL